MKKINILIIFLFFSFGICNNLLKGQICVSQTERYSHSSNLCDNNPWVLVFEDNFNGNTLDLSKWNPKIGVTRDFDFIRQKAWHLPENLEVSNGTLKILSKKPTTPYIGTFITNWNPYTTKTENFEYTTGELSTNQQFSFGKFEARIKIPKGKGFWPAYWLIGGNPCYNEIDIFEFWSTDGSNYNQANLSKKHYMAAFYDYQNNGNIDGCSTNYTGVDFSQDFHIFTLIWENDKIEWYVDGVLKRTNHHFTTILGQPAGCVFPAGDYIREQIYPIDPMSIVLNVAIESGNANSKAGYVAPDNTTPFPSQMEVDWVRYYKRLPCSNDNITFTNTSNLPAFTDASTITTTGTVTVKSTDNITFKINDKVILNPDFKVELGGKFEIDLYDCANQ
jgi:beta-glucanase (GH16 family)